MAQTLTTRLSLKRTWRQSTWTLAVIAIFLDALTTQAAMSWAGAVEGNPLWANLFNNHGMLWPVAITMIVVLTVVSMHLLNYPLDKRLDIPAIMLWVALWVTFAFRVPVILNNWAIAVGGL
jgi:hypothetical protein